jgi:hypothetical protein
MVRISHIPVGLGLFDAMKTCRMRMRNWGTWLAVAKLKRWTVVFGIDLLRGLSAGCEFQANGSSSDKV